MTAPSLAAVPETALRKDDLRVRPRTLATAALPLHVLAGAGLPLAMVVVLEVLGRPPGIEPVALVAIVVAVAGVIGGLTTGFVAATVGTLYAVYYYAQPGWAGVAGNGARIALTVVGAAAAIWLTAALRDRLERVRSRAARQAALGARIQSFTLEVANEPAETVPDALVRGAARLLDTDMCVLTLLDPQTGRHFVRAVHGGRGSAMGVEVIPGVGVTGQALRERRTVVGACPKTINQSPTRQGWHDRFAGGTRVVRTG